ncbi:hypothetical protein HCN51_31610 [Nonomuraea sp. FMUSA5-5]|uniref:Uncharacterized protein n=1 Tax=Nonomuraea composti TaxID=2720023 RepID=A0ABX1BAQ7_9ACTN|nr:hypothetical protein [Nonomuraea sp. FMUSA5-5]NJP93932.1 hypothetical protein [Nonomuraea sp. FMUSA5-5]
MSTQLTVWDPPAPPRRRRWVPRCEDCGRRIWAAGSLTRRFGRLLGGRCHRKRARAARRLTIPVHIVVRDPGHIPGQIEIEVPA